MAESSRTVGESVKGEGGSPNAEAVSSCGASGVGPSGASAGGLGATVGVTVSEELLYCVKNYVDLYGDTVDPEELRESLQRGHGFVDVDLATVKWALETLQAKPRILYGRPYKDYSSTKLEIDEGSPSTSTADDAAVDAAAADGEDLTSISALLSEHAATSAEVAAAAGWAGRRKVKLTQDILNVVASTLDEAGSEVHSLLSLKRVLERKGIFISKTSVYRALEKLGRSIIEKKRNRPKQGTATTIGAALSSAGSSKGPLDLSLKPSKAKPGPLTVAQMLDERSGGQSKNVPVRSRRKVIRTDIMNKKQKSGGKKRRRVGRPYVPSPAPPPAVPVSSPATQQLLAVTAGGQTMLLSGHVIPPKRLRALLPKPSPSQTQAIVSAATTSPSKGVDTNQTVLNPSIPVQMNQEGVATIPPQVNVVPLSTVVRTPKILSVTGSPSPIITPPTTTVSPAIPLKSSPVDSNVPTPDINDNTVKKEENPVDGEGDAAPSPMIKIEIDDPAYRTEGSKDPADPTARDTAPVTMTAHTTTPSTITPPPRIESLHTRVNPHPAAERLTKSVSPQLLSRGSRGSPLGEEKTHDVRGRAIQQFRLNKAIGKIANMKSQGQAVRAPRKPSVVFHRPSVNSTPVAFKVRNDPPLAGYRVREAGVHAGLTSSGATESPVLAQFSKVQRMRAWQMMRAARGAQQRSALASAELQRLHPTSLHNGKIVTSSTGQRRRLAARLQQLKSTSPLYYRADPTDEELVPELEIDPPDRYETEEEETEQPRSKRLRRIAVDPDAMNALMRQSLSDMTEQMRKLSDHMETIQGQLQCILEILPSMIPRSRDQHQETPDQPLNMSNGHMRSSSPPSNEEEQSLDSDEGATENGNLHRQLAIDFEHLPPPLGSPESDALIKEVMDDHRWDQMTSYAGAPRLAIALARYCIFGTKVLMESSVTGRNSKNPLDHGAMRKIKELLEEKYGDRCNNQLEFEMVWKTSRESISQLCKRLRRKYQLAESLRANGLDGESQEDFVIDYK